MWLRTYLGDGRGFFKAGMELVSRRDDRYPRLESQWLCTPKPTRFLTRSIGFSCRREGLGAESMTDCLRSQLTISP